MHSISLRLVSFVLTLAVYGCYDSRERGDEVDSGFDGADVTVQTGGASGNDSGDDAGMNDAPCAPNCPELQWVTIRGGTFIMGSPEGIDTSFEQPQHEVTVQTFKISKTEITVEQYAACVDARICSEPRSSYETHNWSKSGRENHPINGASWFQAEVFAQWLGGRLPSEAEWEYAARSGGREIVYPWGNEDATCERAVIGRDEGGNECVNEMSAEVCSKPLGNTAQGLCDMAGNVSEWVEDDQHLNYRGAPSDGQAWIDSPRSDLRVLRGGDWLDSPIKCRSAARGSGATPHSTDDYYGFRVVLDIK
jgi:formylglycine-generating enzyme required for sulfatase activity